MSPVQQANYEHTLRGNLQVWSVLQHVGHVAVVPTQCSVAKQAGSTGSPPLPGRKSGRQAGIGHTHSGGVQRPEV